MTRAAKVRAVVALALTALAAILAMTQQPRLGLDLRGGTQLVLETQDSATVKATSEATDRALEVLRRRVDALGVAEPTLARSGERRIIVELPGVQDPQRGGRGHRPHRPAHLPPRRRRPWPSRATSRRCPTRAGSRSRLMPARDQRSTASADAAAASDPQRGSGWSVTIDFRDAAPGRMGLTGEAACAPPGDPKRRVAIVLDDKVISSPQVDPSVACRRRHPRRSHRRSPAPSPRGGQASWPLLIKGGALPVPVEMIEQRTVGPTLGADAIEASAKAAVIGVLAHRAVHHRRLPARRRCSPPSRWSATG